MIVLDATVLIAYLDGEDVHHRAATRLLVEHADESMVANALTVAETLVRPARTGRVVDATAAFDVLGLQIMEVGPDDAVRLAVLRSETGLRLPDCCVLLTAESIGGTLATFDERLSQVAAGRGVPVAGLRS